MKMKWSWILVLVMAGFIAMIVGFGVVMMRSDSELYEGDYYQKGEHYAERMDAVRIGNELQFDYDREHHELAFSHTDSIITVSALKLIKISDAKSDFKVNVQGASGRQLRIPIKALEGTDWIMEASGTVGQTPFFRKERL